MYCIFTQILQFGCIIIHDWKIHRKKTRKNNTEAPMKMCVSFFCQLNHTILVSIAIDWTSTALSECEYVCLWHPVCNMQPILCLFFCAHFNCANKPIGYHNSLSKCERINVSKPESSKSTCTNATHSQCSQPQIQYCWWHGSIDWFFKRKKKITNANKTGRWSANNKPFASHRYYLILTNDWENGTIKSSIFFVFGILYEKVNRMIAGMHKCN